jgi:hypothetical protein
MFYCKHIAICESSYRILMVRSFFENGHERIRERRCLRTDLNNLTLSSYSC